MKILASDYDGTLSFGGFDAEKREAIARWRAAGNLFGLVSGRSADGLWDLAARDGFDFDYMIGNNGAVVLDRQKRILFDARCDGRLALPLVRALFEWDCPIAVLHNQNTFTLRPTEEACGESELTIDRLPPVPWFYQITTFLSSEREAQEIASRIRGRFGSRLNPLPNGTCVDCVGAGVNKAQGIYRLIEALGADEKDVITVGDQMNDADMISAFRSYAMANGAEAIRNMADAVTPGVPELIRRELK